LGIRVGASFIAIPTRGALHVPSTRAKVTEPNQEDVVTSTVVSRLEQILHAAETRFACQITRDIREANRPNRIHDNLPLAQAVATARLDVGPHPNADAARDPPAPNAFAKTFGEHHDERRPTAGS